MAGIGAYYLEDLDEKAVPHPWNVNNLKGIIINKSISLIQIFSPL